MLDINEKIIQPDYFKKFKCIHSKCEENCCSRWLVFLDEETYKKYGKIKNKKIRKKILTNIEINKKCSFKQVDYAAIRPKFNYLCPFLTREKKCFIHGTLGEEYLGAVCNLYPRYINKLDNTYERGLDCSCIEAARLVLFKEEGIKFEESSEKLKGSYFFVKEIQTEECKRTYESRAFIKEIRSKSIDIVQNRNIDLSSRLLMLGDFLEETREYICYDYENVTKFIEKYNIQDKEYRFIRKEKNYWNQLEFYIKMVNKSKYCGLLSYSSSKYFKNNMKKIIKKAQKNPYEYINAYVQCEENVINKYTYIFENYIVNEIFINFFPFSKNNIMYNDYLMLLFKYAFIKFYITGMLVLKNNISANDILWSIQSFEKKVGHDSEYLEWVRLYLIENQMDNWYFAAMLL